jgi:hypothetical protein
LLPREFRSSVAHVHTSAVRASQDLEERMTAREAFEEHCDELGLAVLEGDDVTDENALYLTETYDGQLVVNDCLLIADDEDMERVIAFIEPQRTGRAMR